jgi:predicted DCC family thiol-disulfide oxidoreductase YuxK
MPRLEVKPFRYRDDASVPSFDDRRPLFLFDGVCVLCSSGAAFLMRHEADVDFASAQSNLGKALYRHYGMEIDSTYLLIANGLAFTKTDGYFLLLGQLHPAWRILAVFKIVPRPVRDWVYDLVAKNRYRWFGKVEYCQLLSAEQRSRLLDH